MVLASKSGSLAFHSSLVKVDFTFAAPVINKSLFNRKTALCIIAVIKKRIKVANMVANFLSMNESKFKQYCQIPNSRDNFRGKHTQKWLTFQHSRELVLFLMILMMTITMTMMMMMMMIICFCGTVVRWKTLRLTSSRGHCQRFSPLRVSYKPWAGFELAQKLNLSFIGCSLNHYNTTSRLLLYNNNEDLCM